MSRLILIGAVLCLFFSCYDESRYVEHFPQRSLDFDDFDYDDDRDIEINYYGTRPAVHVTNHYFDPPPTKTIRRTTTVINKTIVNKKIVNKRSVRHTAKPARWAPKTKRGGFREFKKKKSGGGGFRAFKASKPKSSRLRSWRRR